jgi:hypothetical protein
MKKKFTEEEVTAIENSAYNQGILTGFYQMHDLISESITTVQNALNEVWSIESLGTKSARERCEQLEFATNAVIHLSDVFEANYYMKLSKVQDQQGPLLDAEGLEDYLDELGKR